MGVGTFAFLNNALFDVTSAKEAGVLILGGHLPRTSSIQYCIIFIAFSSFLFFMFIEFIIQAFTANAFAF